MISSRFLPHSIRIGVQLILFFSGISLFAQAPASLEGKIIRLSGNYGSGRSIIFSSVLLRSGRFHYITSFVGSTTATPYGPIYGMAGGVSDGPYTYTVTDFSHAEVVLTTPDLGVPANHCLLDFASSNGGGASFTSFQAGILSPTIGGSFSLVEESDFKNLPLTNSALRGRVGPGQSLIAGLVISGTAPKTVLIRAVGPSLSPLGVSGVWADPDFELYSGSLRIFEYDRTSAGPPSASTGNTSYHHYPDWDGSEDFKRLFAYLGAFPLTIGSKDAVRVIQLNPGAYTVVCGTTGSDPGGEALIEVYMLP